MIQEYVVINAMTTSLDNNQARLLVQKNRPTWQVGFLNLIGGKVELDEHHEDAAIRELVEETGLSPVCYLPPLLMGKLVCPDAIIYCYNVWVNEQRPLQPQKGETEKVAWFNWYDVLNDKRLMPNLRVILPLMQAGVYNWIINVSENSLGKEFHEVNLVLPSSNHPEHSETIGVCDVLLDGKDIIKRKTINEKITASNSWYSWLWWWR